MTSISAADFDAFFGDLYESGGRRLEPFPWQRRLVRRVLGEDGDAAGWPRVLALPTASGKTACLDIAVFTLACQADRPPAERLTPRRIFFVVDRRVIVDEAFERALELVRRLEGARDGILREVADRLRLLAGSGDSGAPLAAFELRGGVYRDDAWARTPLQPTIVASTVDQVGSRLLYRGYGVSSRSWPIHAGLAAHDALVILDEAHCSQPFGETLDSIRRYRTWASEPIQAPFAQVSMTATPRPDVPESDVFELDDEDRADPELGRRLAASKPAVLLSPIPGRSGSSRFVRALCDQARAHAEAGARRIAILVNRVDTARKVYEQLGDRAGDRVLMIGRMRPWDRDRVLARWRPQLRSGAASHANERPVFVAATQCLEVGADLDFDALVTECASLDALRQRFGRLNRLGRVADPRAAILVAADDLKPGQEDFVYGHALRETWSFLTTHAEATPDGEAVDFGIARFSQVWNGAARAEPSLVERLSPPAPHAPVMLPSHLDVWVQTAPAPLPDPDPSPFLHGQGRGAPEVQVCWRSDLASPDEDRPDLDELLGAWRSTAAAISPSSAECMPVPLHTVRRWLDGLTTASDDLTDVEGSTARPEDEEAPAATTLRRVMRWRGPEDCEVAVRGRQLRPGDTVVIPTALGGWSVFGYIPPMADGRLLVDIAEPTHLVRRRRAILRLHPSLSEQWPPGALSSRLEMLAGSTEASLDADELRAELSKLLSELAARGESMEELSDVVRDLAELGIDPRPHASGHGWVLRARRRRATPVLETYTSDDDSASATTDVGLEDHCEGVAALARRFTEACCAADALAGDLELAGRFHDLGKADPRFQAWLFGGSTLAAQLAPERLAKSSVLPDDARERERARKRAGYPRGSRHELVSVRLVESGGSRLLATASDPDLVLHLIAAHHGRCRPLAPVVEDADPIHVDLELGAQSLSASSATRLELLDSGVPERFWRLVRRYGWWGLAFFEALFRLADHRRSEDEEHRSSERDADRRRANA